MSNELFDQAMELESDQRAYSDSEKEKLRTTLLELINKRVRKIRSNFNSSIKEINNL